MYFPTAKLLTKITQSFKTTPTELLSIRPLSYLLVISLSFSSSDVECKGKTGTCPTPVFFTFDFVPVSMVSAEAARHLGNDSRLEPLATMVEPDVESKWYC